MTCNEYRQAVINLFREGNPTKDQWEAMSYAVLNSSEEEYVDTSSIDCYCDPQGWEKGCYGE